MKSNKVFKIECFSLVAIVFFMILAAITSYKSNKLAAAILAFSSLSAFIVIWWKSKNLFNYLGLVYIGFVFIIGLANLRLAAYQHTWTVEAWVCFIGAVAMFGTGYLLSDKIHFKKFLKNEISYNPKNLYYFGIVICILMVLAFLTKWYVAKTIPLFSWTDAQTYVRFMSGEGYLDGLKKHLANHQILYLIIKAWHRFSNIFSFQSWLASSLVYTYYVKGKPTLKEKIVVFVVIFLSIMNPILMVVREIFLMQTVSFAVLAYFINENKVKKFVLVALMVVLTGVGYYGMSNSRGYSAERLADTFEMTEGGVVSWTEDEETGELLINKEKPVEVTTNYPGIVIWLYTYFTCGFDNFNHLTESLDYQTYGLMQIRPIFSAFQIPRLKDVDNLLQKPKYRVSPNVTIYTFLVDAYVDFRGFGVFVSMLIWGLLFGGIAKKTINDKDLIFTIIYAGLGHHVIFMFFSPWMDHFSYLCSFGLLVLFYLFYYKKVAKKEQQV